MSGPDPFFFSSFYCLMADWGQEVKGGGNISLNWLWLTNHSFYKILIFTTFIAYVADPWLGSHLYPTLMWCNSHFTYIPSIHPSIFFFCKVYPTQRTWHNNTHYRWFETSISLHVFILKEETGGKTLKRSENKHHTHLMEEVEIRPPTSELWGSHAIH